MNKIFVFTPILLLRPSLPLLRFIFVNKSTNATAENNNVIPPCHLPIQKLTCPIKDLLQLSFSKGLSVLFLFLEGVSQRIFGW